MSLVYLGDDMYAKELMCGVLIKSGSANAQMTYIERAHIEEPEKGSNAFHQIKNGSREQLEDAIAHRQRLVSFGLTDELKSGVFERLTK